MAHPWAPHFCQGFGPAIGSFHQWSTGYEDRTGPTVVTLRSRPEVHAVEGGLYLRVGDLLPRPLHGLAIDVSLRYPVAGLDYPRGPTFSAGMAYEMAFGE